jgi:uncharacterized membrane protein
MRKSCRYELHYQMITFGKVSFLSLSLSLLLFLFTRIICEEVHLQAVLLFLLSFILLASLLGFVFLGGCSVVFLIWLIFIMWQ